MNKHTKEDHTDEMVYFNLYNGGLIYLVNEKVFEFYSLYKNAFRHRWTSDAEVKAFTFDKEEYVEIKNKIMTHNLFDYVKAKLHL